MALQISQQRFATGELLLTATLTDESGRDITDTVSKFRWYATQVGRVNSRGEPWRISEFGSNKRRGCTTIVSPSDFPKSDGEGRQRYKITCEVD